MLLLWDEVVGSYSSYLESYGFGYRGYIIYSDYSDYINYSDYILLFHSGLNFLPGVGIEEETLLHGVHHRDETAEGDGET